jgi:hypothetical protein
MITSKVLKSSLTAVKNAFVNPIINCSNIKNKGQDANINVNQNITSGRANESPHLRPFSCYKNELSTSIRVKGMNILVKLNERKFQEKLEFQGHVSLHLTDSAR